MLSKDSLTELISKTGFLFLAIFTFIFPLKFSLPYTQNIDFSVPLNLSEYIIFSWPTEWGHFLLLVPIICIFLKEIINGEKFLSSCTLDVILLFWILSSFVVFSFHGIKSEGLQNILLFFSYALYYLSLRYFLNSEKRKDWISLILFSSFIITVGYGFYQYYEGLDKTLEEAYRYNLPQLDNLKILGRLKGKKVFSTFIYSNSYAGYLLIMIPFMWGSLLNSKKRYSFLYSIIFGIIFIFFLLYIISGFLTCFVYLPFVLSMPFSSIYMLFLTRSKGAMIIFLLTSLALISIFIWRKISGKGKGLLILFVILIVISIDRMPKNFKSRLMASYKVRAEYNEASLKMLTYKPFKGVGFGKYGSYYMKFKSKAAEEVQLAHNTFFQMFAEGGLLTGGAFLLLFLYPLIFLIKRLTFYNSILLIILLNIILHNFIDFDFHVPGIGFLIFYILYLCSEEIEKTKRSLKKMIFNVMLVTGIFGASFFFMINYKIYRSLEYSEIGRRNLARKNLKGAIGYFMLAANEYPFIASNFVDVAVNLERIGQFDKAEDNYKRALSISSHNAVIWRKYAKCMLVNDYKNGNFRYVEILNAFNKAHDNYPHNDDIKRELQKFKALLKKKNLRV